MEGYRRCLWLAVAVGLTGLSGASCPQMVSQYTDPPPRVLPPSPTLEQVIEVVNRNNSQIHSLSSSQARITAPGLPTLRASLAFQRPKRLRLRAGTGIAGPEVDLGSNDELFWFWIKRSRPPAIYFCRHDQFASSPARRMIPIQPDWLVEALGTAGFDPALPHQGPFPLAGDRLEIRTIRETDQGPVTKVTVVGASSGWVLEQRLHNAQGQMVARSLTGRHRQDPLTGLYVPTAVRIDCPAAEFSMGIELDDLRVNRISGNPAELWTIPSYQGSPLVDLGDPSRQFPPAASPPAVSRQPRPAPGLERRRY